MHGRVGEGEEGRVGLDIGYQAEGYSAQGRPGYQCSLNSKPGFVSTVIKRIVRNIPLRFNGFGWREKENHRQANEKQGIKRDASRILPGECDC